MQGTEVNELNWAVLTLNLSASVGFRFRDGLKELVATQQCLLKQYKNVILILSNFERGLVYYN